MLSLKRIALVLGLLTLWGWEVCTFGAHKAAFVAGGIYNEQVRDLRESGFDTIICWSLHIHWDGRLVLNDHLLIHNGSYQSGSWAKDNIAKLKQAPTSITRLEMSIGAWGVKDFEAVENLINTHGTGRQSILYRNFQALRTHFPDLDAINFDDESNYDVESTTKFAVMLADLGYKVTLCPYARRTSFWAPLYDAIEAKRPGAIDHVYLQCYAGGRFNRPSSWNGLFGDLIVEPGMWAQKEDNPAEVQAQMEDWREDAGIQGGFIWRLSYMKQGGYRPIDYALAIEEALTVGPRIHTQPVSRIIPAVYLGSSPVLFTLAATSEYPLEYQWYKTSDKSVDTPEDDSPVGAGGSKLVLDTLQVEDEGYYYCVIRERGGDATKSQVVGLGIGRLLAHWSLDLADYGTDGNDPNLYYLDRSGVGHHAAPNDVPLFVDGIVDGDRMLEPVVAGAVDMDSDGCWAQAGTWDPAALTSQMTISAWVKITRSVSNQQALVSKHVGPENSDVHWSLQMRTGDGAHRLAPYVLLMSPQGDSLWASMPYAGITEGEWFHVAAVVDVWGDSRIYLNKRSMATLAEFRWGGKPQGEIFLGLGHTGAAFPGLMDDVRIYNYALSETQVAETLYAPETGEGQSGQRGR